MAGPSERAGVSHGVLITAAAVMPVMAIIGLVPVLPLLEREFSEVQGSEFLVPAALTIPALCLAIFSPVAGWFADRLGRKPLLVGALFLYAVIGVLPYFLTDLKQILGARFLLGVTEAAIMTTATTLVGDYYSGRRRERWFGIQVATVSIAAIVLVAIGGILGEMLGSRGPFLMYLLAFPLAIACLLHLFEPAARREKSEHADKLPIARMYPLLIGGFLLGILFYVTIVRIGDILSLKTVISPGLVGQISSITNIGVALGAVVFGFMKSRASGPGLFALGMVLIAVGYAAVPYASNVPLTTLSAFFVCLGAGMLIPTMLTWVMSMLPHSIRGRGVGLWQGTFFLGQFVAPITSTALVQNLGSFEYALLIYACLAGAMAIVAILNNRASAARLSELSN